MNVLFLTHRLPYAPNRGDRIRAYYLLQEISRFADISLLSLVHDPTEASRASDVPFISRIETALVPRLANFARGAFRLPTARPLTHSLLDAPTVRSGLARLIRQSPPDVVVAYCSGMAQFAVRPPLDRIPFVLDMVDVDSQKWRELARQVAPPRRWVYAREARKLAAFEALASARARCVLVTSEREREALRAIASEADIVVIPNGVDVSAFAPPSAPAAAPAVVFTGVMDYEPNVDAVVTFAERVWPTVRARFTDARFTIVGARPARSVQMLAERDHSIVVTGSVESVQPYLWQAAVSVAPIALARGIQNKVLEALAAGLPAVVSTAVASGLPAGIERGCIVADEPNAVAGAVLALLDQTPDARRTMAASAGVERLSWQQQLSPVRAIVTAAAASATTGSTT